MAHPVPLIEQLTCKIDECQCKYSTDKSFLECQIGKDDFKEFADAIDEDKGYYQSTHNLLTGLNIRILSVIII